MNLLKPFLAFNFGFGVPAEKIEVPQAIQEITNYCQEVNRRHANYITVQDVAIALRSIKLTIINESVGDTVKRSLVSELKRNFFLKIILGCQTASFDLSTSDRQPDALLPDVLYLVSPYQADDWSAGLWSLFNARAINQLLERGQQLSSESISSLSREPALAFIKGCKGKWQADRELFAVARDLNIPNVTILAHYGGDKVRPLDDIWPYDAVQAVAHENNPEALRARNNLRAKIQSLAIIRRKVDTWVLGNEQGAHHFVCQINNSHWILLSVVKLRNRNPILIILDPKKLPIGPNSLAARYIQFAHKLFIAPYHLVNVGNHQQEDKGKAAVREAEEQRHQDIAQPLQPGIEVNRCTICLEDYQQNENITALPCGHIFHAACISRHIKLDSSCPLCRQVPAELDAARFDAQLLLATVAGNAERVIQALKHGASLNAQDEDRHTPLFIAAALGRIAIVQALLTHADINSFNELDESLKIAVQKGHKAIVQLLLGYGALADKANKEFIEALDKVLDNQLLFAAVLGDVSHLEDLVEKNKGSSLIQDALLLAAAQGHTAFVKRLVLLFFDKKEIVFLENHILPRVRIVCARCKIKELVERYRSIENLLLAVLPIFGSKARPISSAELKLDSAST